jgi:hypothetical protein
MRAPTMSRVLVVLLTTLAAGVLLHPRTVSHAVAGQLRTELRRERHAGPVCEDPFATDPRAEARPLFVVQGGTAVQVAQEFVRFLQQNDIEAEIYEEVFVLVRYNHDALLLDLRVGLGDLSRIIVAKVFDLAPEYRHTLALSAYLLRLNMTFDFANFALSPKADRLIVQGSITFVDHLEAHEVRKFLDFFYRGTVRMFDVLPETAQFLQ